MEESPVRTLRFRRRRLEDDDHVRVLLQIAPKETSAALQSIRDATIIEPMRSWFRTLPLRGCWHETLRTEEDISSVVDRIRITLMKVVGTCSFRAMSIRRFLAQSRLVATFIVTAHRRLKEKKAQVVRQWASLQLAKRTEVSGVVRDLAVRYRSSTAAKVLEAAELGFELFVDEATMGEVVDNIWRKRRDSYLAGLRQARANRAMHVEAQTAHMSLLASGKVWREMLRGYPWMVFRPSDVSVRELCSTLVALQRTKLLKSITLLNGVEDTMTATRSQNLAATSNVDKGAAAEEERALSTPVSLYHALLSSASIRTEVAFFTSLKEMLRGDDLSYAASTDPNDERAIKRATKVFATWGRTVKKVRHMQVGHHLSIRRPSSRSPPPARTSPTKHELQERQPLNDRRRTIGCINEHTTIQTETGDLAPRHVESTKLVGPSHQPATPTPPPLAPPAQRGAMDRPQGWRPASARCVRRNVSPPDRSPQPSSLEDQSRVWGQALRLHKATCNMYRRRTVAASPHPFTTQAKPIHHNWQAAPPNSAAAPLMPQQPPRLSLQSEGAAEVAGEEHVSEVVRVCRLVPVARCESKSSRKTSPLRLKF